MNRYVGKILRTGVLQLRVIPIGKSLTPQSYVATYDDLRKIIENMESPFCVAKCICRKAAEMKGENQEHQRPNDVKVSPDL
ncbi:MAG: hypothetical protein ACTSUQ_12265 [Candidatus Freyarchaeota archaeon]